MTCLRALGAVPVLVLLILLAALAAPVRGQVPAAETPSERWERLAGAAEGEVANPGLTSARLEALRAAMVAQRADALTARKTAEQALAPLRVQIDALGPAPEGDAIEAPEIAGQRLRLKEEIAAAEVPLKSAEAAFRRAEALIARIDTILRARFRDELLHRQVSPLDPAVWGPSLAEIAAIAGRVRAEAAAGLEESGGRVGLAVALGLLGLFLLVTVRTRVMTWFERRLAPTIAGGGETHRQIWAGGGLTFAALLIPATGFFLILSGVSLSGAANGIAASFFRDAGGLAAILVVAYWLSVTLFGVDVPARDIFPLQPRKARRAARMTLVLGLVLGLDTLIVSGRSAAWMSIGTISIWNFALICLGALTLWRLASAVEPEPVAERVAESEAEEPAEVPPRLAIGRLILVSSVRTGRALCLLAPVLAAAGFHAASRYAFFPFVVTMAVCGSWIVVVALVEDGVEAWLAGRGPGATASSRLRLLPPLVGFLLTLVALPPLALVWGARESDIDEIGLVLTEGVAFGETRIAPLDVLTFGAIFAAGFLLTRFVQSVLRSTVLPQTALDSGGRMAVNSMVGYVGIVLAAIAAISATGLDLSNLAIVAGALSVGIGFGLQNVVSNFVSGLILLIERPVKEGDWIKVGEFEGIVRRISVRATSVQTFDRAVVVVPNADLVTRPVLNRTHSGTIGRVIAPVGVAYGTDTRRAEAVLREIASGCEFLLRRPPPLVAFRGFGADALTFEIVGYLRDVNTVVDATTWLNHRIAERFAAEGIEIPFAQRDLHLRNLSEIGEMLRGLAPAARTGGTTQDPEDKT